MRVLLFGYAAPFIIKTVANRFTSLTVVVKEKSLFDSAAPEKKEDTIFFFTKLELAIAISHVKLIIPN
jgi:hypothetical protein